MQDTIDHLRPLEELLRIPSPAPGSLGLAADGTTLWIASIEVARIYGLDTAQGTVFEENAVPGDPYGMCVTGDALRVVTGEDGDEDNRYIRRYIMGKGFKDQERYRCPDSGGSFLAYDGDILYLTQKHEMRICVLTPDVECERTIPTDMPINGICVIDGCFYLVVSGGNDSGDHRLRKVDARGETPVVTDLGRIGFNSRSLTYDGAKLWVTDRKTNDLVALALPK